MKSKSSWYRWVILLVCMLIYCTAELIRWNYTGISGHLMTAWHINQADLGILGSVFFYAYAIGQVPWGIATDKFGGTRVIPVGLVVVAICMSAFVLSGSFHLAIFWRAVLGFVSGAAFIPASQILTEWFSPKERGLAMTLFIGTGGGLGEIMSFLLMPIFTLLLTNGHSVFGFTSWKGSTILTAVVVVIFAFISIIFLKHNPAVNNGHSSVKSMNYKQNTKKIFSDIKFWMFSLIWSGFTVGTRLIPAWLVLYATDYYLQTGVNKSKAVVFGGLLSTIYVLGRAIGTPIVGIVSDHLIKRGIPRTLIVFVVQFLMIFMYAAYIIQIHSVIYLGGLAFVTGILINLVSMMNTIGSEYWSSDIYGTLVGLANMVGQFIGAGMLAISGFMAIYFKSVGTGFYTQFNGIWITGIIYTIITTTLAFLFLKLTSAKRVAH
ncbi:MFS transporter [Levilactobacillus fujinensis]|uniref:MFS transporter n=1 Tax=Levilactobacillus fujinensis TaxID=2486024 RepID=A0ABW1TES6_9LACO|nr:MFS transporter [Levilactobacillus fujinensis]